MTRGRAPIGSGRYVPVIINGQRQWARDQVALQAEIVTLLTREGAMPKKRIIMTLSTAQAAIETALASLLLAGKIERYRALSARRRMDEQWCIAGNAPTKEVTRFRAEETLLAFRDAARRTWDITRLQAHPAGGNEQHG